MRTSIPAWWLGIIGIAIAYSLYIGYTVYQAQRMQEGMENRNPEVEDLKKQAEVMQNVYDELKNMMDNQTNRIQANAQMLLKIISDTPNQTNSVTHANVNQDDPSKTRIPKIAI
jgi:hypothetical protein